MQLIGHYLTIYADNQGALENLSVELALSAAKAEYKKDICNAALHGSSEKDIEFLCAMLEDPVHTRTKDIAERLGVSNSHVQTYKRRLVEAGLIRQVARGVVSFDVPMLREYLAENYCDG